MSFGPGIPLPDEWFPDITMPMDRAMALFAKYMALGMERTRYAKGEPALMTDEEMAEEYKELRGTAIYDPPLEMPLSID
jgi:hypothetical protein